MQPPSRVVGAPEPPLRVGDADGEGEPVARRRGAKRREQRVARPGRIARRGLRVGEADLDAVRRVRPSGSSAQDARRGGAPPWRARASAARWPPRRARRSPPRRPGRRRARRGGRAGPRRRRRAARARRRRDRGRRAASRRRRLVDRVPHDRVAEREPARRAAGPHQRLDEQHVERVERVATRRARRPPRRGRARTGRPTTAARVEQPPGAAGQRAELRRERRGHGGRHRAVARRSCPAPGARARAARGRTGCRRCRRRRVRGRSPTSARASASSSGPGASRVARAAASAASAPRRSWPVRAASASSTRPAGGRCTSAASASADPGSAQCTSSRQSTSGAVGRDPLELGRAARGGADGDRPRPRRSRRPAPRSQSAYGRSASYSEARAASTVHPLGLLERGAASSRDLPMPGSPSITSTPPAPPRSAASASGDRLALAARDRPARGRSGPRARFSLARAG